MNHLYKKTLINEILENIIFEDIYSNKAIVYHRTRSDNLIKGIYTKGYHPSDINTLGIGFYGSYDLESQLNDKMKIYGETIVKFMVNSLKRFLILDYDQFIIVHKNFKEVNDKNFIEKQLLYFNFDKFYFYNDMLKMINFKSSSHDILERIINYYFNDVKSLVDGIIYTDSYDGKTLICYEYDLLIPISFSIDEAQNWLKHEPKNIDYLKKIYDFTNKTFFKKNDNNDKKLKWLNDVKISSDSRYEINSNKDPNQRFIWYDGTWEDGTWEYGTWKNGLWKKGIWLGGIWEKGFCELGHWRGGTWKNGTMEEGVFINSTWENGDWWSGLFKESTWENGNWINGVFLNSKWEGGIWENGTWENSWIYDPHKKGNYELNWKWKGNYVKSPIPPNKYFT